MGTPHPKALRAASQEAWPDTGQTLGNVAQGSVRSEQYQRNIRKVPRRIDSYLTNGWRALSRDSRGPSSPIQQGPDSISGCLPAIRIRSHHAREHHFAAYVPRSWVPALRRSLRAAPRPGHESSWSTTGLRSPDAAQRHKRVHARLRRAMAVRCRAGAHAPDRTLIA
jgi:hypothetical protein